jgi:hypothetical protein
MTLPEGIGWNTSWRAAPWVTNATKAQMACDAGGLAGRAGAGRPRARTGRAGRGRGARELEPAAAGRGRGATD